MILYLFIIYFNIWFNLNVLFSWKAPRYILNMPDTRHERVRKKFHILVDGDGIPAPIKSFREMKFPPGYKTFRLLHINSTLSALYGEFWHFDVINNWQIICCCSNSKRFEKEGHCASHADSNSRNPHSVSTVNGHALLKWIVECIMYFK